jgi:hypothetical protein
MKGRKWQSAQCATDRELSGAKIVVGKDVKIATTDKETVHRVMDWVSIQLMDQML